MDAGEGAGIRAGALGGRSGVAVGTREARAARERLAGRSAWRKPQWLWQTAPVFDDERHDHRAEAQGARLGGTLREQDSAAVQAAHPGGGCFVAGAVSARAVQG